MNIFSPYGGFSEGDHVTRDGTDVHLVKDMSADGFSASFVCTVAPATGWTQVGEEELNLCRRYARLKRDETTQEWTLDREARKPIGQIFSMAEHAQQIIKLWRATNPIFQPYIKRIADELTKALSQEMSKRHRSTYYRNKTGRRPKRRALRK